MFSTKLLVGQILKFDKSALKLEKCFSSYSIDLEKTVHKKKWFNKITESNKLEDLMVNFFKENPTGKSRKQSFIYLLIDPRVSQNLPKERPLLTDHETWKRFIPSIFYVGKGKCNRPHAHLYEALRSAHYGHETGNFVDSKSQRYSKTASRKMNKIFEIWNSGNGVVCLHAFHNILEAEALTREAAIIEALSLRSLTNLRAGNFHGPVKMWSNRCKRKLGALILFKAMRIYLNEGESQLTPKDLI
ncbi:ANKLE1.2 family protein [Megaselia abdita]